MVFGFLKKKEEKSGQDSLGVPPMPVDDFSLNLYGKDLDNSKSHFEDVQPVPEQLNAMSMPGFQMKSSAAINLRKQARSAQDEESLRLQDTANVGNDYKPTQYEEDNELPQSLGDVHRYDEDLMGQLGEMPEAPEISEQGMQPMGMPQMPQMQIQTQNMSRPLKDDMTDAERITERALSRTAEKKPEMKAEEPELPRPRAEDEVPKPPAIFAKDEYDDKISMIGASARREMHLTEEDEERLLKPFEEDMRRAEKPTLRKYSFGSPLFIDVDDYKQVLQDLENVKVTLKESDELLDRLNDLKMAKDKEFERWRIALEDLQKKMIYVDKVIFER